MQSSTLEELLSEDKAGLPHKAFEYLKKHTRAYKLALASVVAFPEMYSVLLTEKELNIIPSYEYQLVYVQHAAVTMPVIYAVAVLGTYIDIELFSKIASKSYKKIKGYLNKKLK